MRGLARQIHQLGSGALQSVCHLVRLDARRDLRIADRIEQFAVQRRQRIETVALRLVVDPRRIRQVQDRIAGVAEGRSAVHRRQESAAVVARPAARSLGARQDDEPRKIARFAPQSVQRPRTEARTPELLRAGVHHDLSGSMIDRFGLHRADQTEVVGDRAEMRQSIAQLHAAFATRLERKLRSQQRRVRIDEGGSITCEQFGRRQLPVAFRQFGLRVEQLELTRRTGLKQIDDSLRLGRKVRLTRGERIGRPLGTRLIAASQTRCGDSRQADAAFLQEPATPQERSALLFDLRIQVHRSAPQFFAIVSSRFSRTRAAIVQAAAS